MCATAAEMVYGTSLRLPGEFFAPLANPVLLDPTNYVSELKTFMHKILPSPPRQTARKSHMSEAFSTCTHVYYGVPNGSKGHYATFSPPFSISNLLFTS